jgi:ubiquinol-cytochrome c reductase core subunit 2
LLGSELFAYHSRENLVVGAKFIRDDLPYFLELIAEVASKTKYQSEYRNTTSSSYLSSSLLMPYSDHVYAEEILPLLKLSQKKFLANTEEMALSSVHGIAFHRGLGEPLFPSSSTPVNKYLDASTIAGYASAAYAKPNFAIVANGADHAEVSKWVGEFFSGVSSSPASGVPAIEAEQTKYYGGEERIAHASGNTLILGFPGSSSFTGGFYKPEIAVLASLLGGKSSIKWSSGFSLLSKASSDISGVNVETKSAIYSDAGLLYTKFHGSAAGVAAAAKKSVEVISAIANGQISKEDITKAKAAAKYKELEFGQNVNNVVELTGTGLVSGNKAYQVDETAKLIDGVDEAKVKAVGVASGFPTLIYADMLLGCEDTPRKQGFCIGCRRPVRPTFRRRARFESVNSKNLGVPLWVNVSVFVSPVVNQSTRVFILNVDTRPYFLHK